MQVMFDFGGKKSSGVGWGHQPPRECVQMEQSRETQTELRETSIVQWIEIHKRIFKKKIKEKNHELVTPWLRKENGKYFRKDGMEQLTESDPAEGFNNMT